ncbi:MAG: PAS domain S-box protein [Thermoplasmatota archaeon]
MVSKKKEVSDHEEVVMNGLPLGIIVMDGEGRIRFMNDHFTKLIGPAEDKVLGNYLYDIVEPSDIPEVLSMMKKGRRDGVQLEMTIRLIKGRSVHGIFTFRDHRFHGEKGSMVTMVEKEQRTKKNEICYEVLEELPMPVVVMEKDLQVQFRNSAADERISLLAKGKDPVQNPSKERKAVLLDCLKNGNPGRTTVSIKTSEGGIDFDVVTVPVRSVGAVDRALEFWLDPPARTEGMGAADLLKGLGDELIDSANALIIGLDLEGTITLWNKGAQRALGYSPEEVKGRSWFDYLLDREAERGKLEVLQWNIGSGFRTRYESKVRSKSGMAMIISLENTVIFDKTGDVSLVLMVGQDITTQKRLEESLRSQSDKLMDAMEESSLYTDLMVHDMHNAIAGIMGYLELLSMGGTKPDKSKEYIERALAEVRKSSSIIKDVKLISQAGPLTQTGTIEISEILAHAVARFQKEMGGECPKIDIDTPEIEVVADHLLEDVVMRVLQHSVRNSKSDKPRISINVRRDPSKTNFVPEPVHIVVADNGGGMDPSSLEGLFNRPRRTDLGSHGLGLYLVKRIISRYQGMVWVETSSGKEKGLEVHILLREIV